MRDLSAYLPNLYLQCRCAQIDPPEIIVEDKEFDHLVGNLQMMRWAPVVRGSEERLQYHGIQINRRHPYADAPYCYPPPPPIIPTTLDTP